MSKTTDQVLAHRRALLISFIVGWLAWYGFFIWHEAGLYARLPEIVEITVALLGAAGWIVFAVSLFKILTLRRRYKDDPVALAALNDELMKQQNARAVSVGFYAIIGTQIFLALFGNDYRWSAEVGAHLSIFVCVTTTVLASLWFEMKDDSSGE